MLRYVMAQTSVQYQLPSAARAAVPLHSSPEVLPETNGIVRPARSNVCFMVMFDDRLVEDQWDVNCMSTGSGRRCK